MTQTTTVPVVHDAAGLRRVGRVMRAVGILGVVAGLVAVGVALWLLRDLDVLLGRSLDLTADSLTTVEASLTVATDAVEVVRGGLTESERTSRGLRSGLDEGAGLLDDTASLLRSEVAASLESVQATLPTIIQVGGTIDSTLRTVDTLGGPAYQPAEPFDATLRSLEENLDGLPTDLRVQAGAIERAGENLRSVGAQSDAVADAIGDVGGSLDEAGDVLGRYEATADRAQALLDDTRSDLTRRVTLLQVLVAALGAVYCIAQLLPVLLGHRLVRAFTPAPVPDDGG